MRFLFGFNLALWGVLFIGWVPYVGLRGIGDPVSVQVGFILAVTAVLLAVQSTIRWRRRQAAKVSA
ncbi:MAG TPA: hypothetical protein VFL27_12215 [Candidatus Dormibacteraeota bacterium]|nr:hypothetical protein [Candidatus Dormibacteraeota bacterium]